MIAACCHSSALAKSDAVMNIIFTGLTYIAMFLCLFRFVRPEHVHVGSTLGSTLGWQPYRFNVHKYHGTDGRDRHSARHGAQVRCSSLPRSPQAELNDRARARSLRRRHHIVKLYVYEAFTLVMSASLLGTVIGCIMGESARHLISRKQSLSCCHAAWTLVSQQVLFTQLPIPLVFPYTLLFEVHFAGLTLSSSGRFNADHTWSCNLQPARCIRTGACLGSAQRSFCHADCHLISMGDLDVCDLP